MVRHEDQAVAEIGPGSVVGELAVLNPHSQTRTATVDAETDIRALVFTPDTFVTLVYVPSVAMKILAALAAKVTTFDRKAFG